ncbi:MAG TPA: hypothetical protein PK990_09565 [Salinivirgaceae bacterium]|nr:hypothetical protein [Salinivirgaceae bacterium]
MKIKMRLLNIVTGILILIFAGSCSGDKSKKVEENIVDEDNEKITQLRENIYKAKQVFYSLPSPIETAMLIKRCGVNYDEKILNPLSNHSKYLSTHKKALNFGIYSADLSYASIFEQTQTAIQYMAAAKNLANELGILNAIDETIIRRLESNITNRDSILDIITESFLNSDTYLKEQGRAETAAVILAGGWIEGLYIAVKSSQKYKQNDDLVDRIIDQKISLRSLQQLLESYKDNPMAAKVLADVKRIGQVYENFDVVYSHIETLTDPDDRNTVLKARTEVFKSANALKTLSQVTDSIRSAYISID